MKRRSAAVALLLLGATSLAQAWGVQGHRLVATVAFNQLTPVAKANVAWLIGPQSLADVANWADEYLPGVNQTAPWHYVNIPPAAAAYDRDRDCPRQPNVAAGARADAWRDCIVDRIRYNAERMRDTKLDRADRAIALKFLVHFVGDIHQPHHATAVERGGNGILVRFFGNENCGGDPARPFRCNLHSVWDTQMIARRGLDDRAFVRVLEQRIQQRGLRGQPAGEPASWAMESLKLSNAALVAADANIDEAYYVSHMPVVEERMALGGVRLAAVLNQALTTRPPR